VKRDLGRPRKYNEGWEGANKRIYISNETFVIWQTTMLYLSRRSAIIMHEKTSSYIVCDGVMFTSI